jgi:flagellar basal-body rod protein FlgB
MRTSLDNYLGIHPQALQLEAKRNELLAANLANVDTPNYKARDIDFKTALSAASGESSSSASGTASTLTLRTTGTSGPAAAAAGGVSAAGADAASGGVDSSAVKYRTPMASALDGNTVDEQLEQSAFAENSVRYQASLQFISGALRDLMTAITGS